VIIKVVSYYHCYIQPYYCCICKRDIPFLTFKGLIENAINVRLQGVYSATPSARQVTLMTEANRKLPAPVPSDSSWSYVTVMKTLGTEAPTKNG
jgi:hypothetical protein